MRIALLVLAAILVGCGGNRSEVPAAGAPYRTDFTLRPIVQPAEFRGFYSAGFEQEAFEPCAIAERWWVSNPALLRRHYEELGARPHEPVYTVVRGDTSASGFAGHLGMYQRYVRIHEVVSMTRVDSVPPAADGSTYVRPRCPAAGSSGAGDR